MKKMASLLRLLCIIMPSVFVLIQSVSAASTPTNPGRVRFFNNADWAFDPYLNNPSTTQKDWMVANYYRMVVHTPYFDTRNSWYPGGLAYFESYGIYVNDPIVNTHPEWIMRDARGNKLYIPFACQNGLCSQYAGDFANPAFRQYQIQKIAAILAKGYRGLWLDDVNFTWRVSDGYGNYVNPVDRNNGLGMSLDSWRLYLVQYLELIRSTFPTAEITHNIIWYADAVDAQNPYINREIDAADYINLERGANDDGLVGGGGQWGYETFLKFVDYIHGRGADVIFLDNSSANIPDTVKLEYGLASWFLISQGNDLIGNISPNHLAWTTQNSWWIGYNTNLGNAVNKRYAWNNLLRRDFDCGMVLLNQPGMPTRTVTVASGYKNLAGQAVSSVTLAAKQAIVLQSSCGSVSPPATTTTTTPPAATTSAVLKDFQQGVNGYTGAKDSFIYKASPTLVNGNANYLYFDGRTNTKSEALFAWNLTSIPQTAQIQKVTLTVNTTKVTFRNYDIFEMKQAWVENQATWNNYATGKPWGSAGAFGTADRGTTVLGTVISSALGQYTTSLNSSGVALVQAWVKNPALNNGFLVMSNTSDDNLILSSKEAGVAGTHPKLSITYKLP